LQTARGDVHGRLDFLLGDGEQRRLWIETVREPPLLLLSLLVFFKFAAATLEDGLCEFENVLDVDGF
jgi:hypothetical protein